LQHIKYLYLSMFSGYNEDRLSKKSQGDIESWARLRGDHVSPKPKDGRVQEESRAFDMKALLYAVRDDMVPLTPEELQEMREHIATFDMSDDDKDAIIRLVDNIVISFILSARGLDAVQLSLSARANSAFIGTENRANLPKYERFERIDLHDPQDCEGAKHGVTDTEAPQTSAPRTREP
jgi:hypothetical protein